MNGKIAINSSTSSRTQDTCILISFREKWFLITNWNNSICVTSADPPVEWEDGTGSLPPVQKFKTSATEAVIGSHTYHTPVITLAVVKELLKIVCNGQYPAMRKEHT